MNQNIIKAAGWTGGIALVLGTAVMADIAANTHPEAPAKVVSEAPVTPKAEPTATVSPKATTAPTVKPSETPKAEAAPTVAPATIPATFAAAPAHPATVSVPVRVSVPAQAPAKPYVPCSAVGMVADANGVCFKPVQAQAPAKVVTPSTKTFVEPYVPAEAAQAEASKTSPTCTSWNGHSCEPGNPGPTGKPQAGSAAAAGEQEKDCEVYLTPDEVAAGKAYLKAHPRP